jgi:hypothetical protein
LGNCSHSSRIGGVEPKTEKNLDGVFLSSDMSLDFGRFNPGHQGILHPNLIGCDHKLAYFNKGVN